MMSDIKGEKPKPKVFLKTLILYCGLTFSGFTAMIYRALPTLFYLVGRSPFLSIAVSGTLTSDAITSTSHQPEHSERNLMNSS